MITRDEALALIQSRSADKRPVVKTLVTEAKYAFRAGQYDKVAKRLSDERIAREIAIYLKNG